MHPYEPMLSIFGCSSYQELYDEIVHIAIFEMGLDGAPFILSALEHPPENVPSPEIINFIYQCFKVVKGNNSDADAIQLIKVLKENAPKESYESPKLPDKEATQDEINLLDHIYRYGIDLPGSKYNPFGHLQNYSSFFIDMFFGNHTEFNDHIKSLSKKELQKSMKRREGYCQFSPIFAPILGIKMGNLDKDPLLTTEEKQKIRTMYSGCNENMYLKILMGLIKLGAEVETHDINGYTPLHYAVQYRQFDLVSVLLQHGANPNSESRSRWRPLDSLSGSREESGMLMICLLIQHNAKITNKEYTDSLRSNVETYGRKELAVRVREAHPREKEECEKCVKPAPKKCGACGLVYYCTPACQKLDWKFHKVICHKNLPLN